MTVITQPPAVGERIPTIELVSPDGRQSSLDLQLDERGGVIYFMRSPGCPVCNAHVKNLARLSAANNLYGYKPIIVVPGDAKAANSVANRHGTAHVAIWGSEEGHEVFGLQVKMLLQQSGTWVVDGERNVLHTTTSTIPIQGLNHEAVRETAAILAGRNPHGVSSQTTAAETRTQPPVRPDWARDDERTPFVLPRSSQTQVGDEATVTSSAGDAPAEPIRDEVETVVVPELEEQAQAPVAPVTPISDRSDRTLGRIVGTKLRAVTFSADYVQLVFGSTTVSCFDWPAVTTANGTFDIGDPGYRDALCSYIGAPVASATVDANDGMAIVVGDAKVAIAAAPERTAATAAMVMDLAEGFSAVWRAGAGSFEQSR